MRNKLQHLFFTATILSIVVFLSISKAESADIEGIFNVRFGERHSENDQYGTSDGKTLLTRVDTPLAKVLTPLARVDTPLARVDTPLARVDTPLARVDTPPARVDTPITSSLISSLTVASGNKYEIVENGLEIGDMVYTDRSYKVIEMPAFLQGATTIKTPNDDKGSSAGTFATFILNKDSIVCIAHDDNIQTKPPFLSSFTDTGADIVTTDTTLSVYESYYLEGVVTLGGNEGRGDSMYIVIIVEQDTGSKTETTPVYNPTIYINPYDPTTEEDVSITFAWSLSEPCYEVYSSHTILGTSIVIDITQTRNSGYCIQVITPTSITEDIGRLPAGIYDVHVFINGLSSETETFAVSSYDSIDEGIGPIISNLNVASGNKYEIVENGLEIGDMVYTDRSYKVIEMPAFLQGATTIKTPNDDKGSSAGTFATFILNKDSIVCIAHDDNIQTKPPFLSSFTDTGADIVTTDTTLSVYESYYLEGVVTLGGNEGRGDSMYIVIVVQLSLFDDVPELRNPPQEEPTIPVDGHGVVHRGRTDSEDRPYFWVWIDPYENNGCTPGGSYRWYQFVRPRFFIDSDGDGQNYEEKNYKPGDSIPPRPLKVKAITGLNARFGQWNPDYHAEKNKNGKNVTPGIPFSPEELDLDNPGKPHKIYDVPGTQPPGGTTPLGGLLDAPNFLNGDNKKRLPAPIQLLHRDSTNLKDKIEYEGQPPESFVNLRVVIEVRSYLVCVKDGEVECIGYVSWTYTQDARVRLYYIQKGIKLGSNKSKLGVLKSEVVDSSSTLDIGGWTSPCN